ncbi:MAG: zinc ribbon domain-containing protein [Saccharofermentans sp.]|nr:zinc ribbon domain-containing protein [Saccharofermentans sp.]
MFCQNCGAQVQPDQLFCNQCGTRQPVDEPAPQPAAAEPVAQPAAEPVVQPVQPAQPIQQAQPVQPIQQAQPVQPVVQPVVQQVVQPAPVVIVQQAAPKPARGPFNAVAIVALVLGVMSIVFFWFPVISWIFCISGLICSIVALVNVKKKNARNKGFGIGGLITSIIGTLILMGYILFVMLVGASSFLSVFTNNAVQEAFAEEFSDDYYT